MTDLETICQKIDEVIARGRVPLHIYVNEKTYQSLTSIMQAVARTEAIPTTALMIRGLRVKVHRDFPEPRVWWN